MINFDKDEVQHIFKIGDGSFDIRAKKRHYDTDIQNKIKGIDNDEIKTLLDHQFNDNPFQFSFVAMLHYKSNENWMPDKEKRSIVKEWLSNIIPINASMARALFEGFLSNSMVGFKEKPIIELIKYKESEEIIEILEFAQILSFESISLHRKRCSDTGCKSERKHVKRTDFIKSKLKEMKPKDNKVSLNKIIWNGKQKELAELFVELKKNGWIEDFEYDTIKACFTNSNSIQQALKPNLDTSTGHSNYEGIYTANYTPMFHGISKNKKSSK